MTGDDRPPEIRDLDGDDREDLPPEAAAVATSHYPDGSEQTVAVAPDEEIRATSDGPIEVRVQGLPIETDQPADVDDVDVLEGDGAGAVVDVDGVEYQLSVGQALDVIQGLLDVTEPADRILASRFGDSIDYETDVDGR